MGSRKKRYILSCFAVILILGLISGAGITMCRNLTKRRQGEVKNILQFYSEKIMLQMQGGLNLAAPLARTAAAAGDLDLSWFNKAEESLLEKDEVRYVCLVEGDTVVRALPQEDYGSQTGRDLKEFSYVYTLGKVVKDFVVEGPVFLDSEIDRQKVFLFLQPFTEKDAYLGEVIVALDCDYVMEQLGFDNLSEQGYDYELWRVNPQNGSKEIVSASQEKVDFSYAVKTAFYMPIQWNLSIQPADGWISSEQKTGILLICSFATIILLSLAYAIYQLYVQKYRAKQHSVTDRQTGLYNRAGFTEALDRWLLKGNSAVLFYLVFEGYDQVSQLISSEEESDFLKNIPPHMEAFIENPFLAGRTGAGNFILAVRENMNEGQQEDFAKGLSLELLLKVRQGSQKYFLTARYQYRCCQNGTCAEAEIAAVIQAYYTKRSEESPVRRLTEKCRRLIKEQGDVVFDEYTDLEMMELSKTLNQYRKQVEQLVYFDPVFSVGNRLKYQRDVNMLISYDTKRKFNLFCIDICKFSQYNDLFNAEIGDEILQEVLNRLSRPFGTYLYRINGDVFLGISLSGECEESFADRLQQLLTRPVTVGDASFALKVWIGICRYPEHGKNPEVLLERIQSSLQFAKESGQEIIIYNDQLNKMIRMEADILRRIEAGIQQGTLEVWYQPMMHLETGRFIAVEALVRLADGNGGYFSAAQVISLAERSGMVERLGDYVLSKACDFMRSSGEMLGLNRMCVNLSVQQLLVENSAEHLLDLIHSSGVNTSQITLEITESILIQSIERVAAVLDKLRNTGIHIALDDFGVGYSSLNYLSNLPVDVIKIDRSLTRQILTSPKQHALLQAIVEMANINSLTVVVEGIETEREQKTIAALKVQFIQGFYYAHPMQGDELIRFSKERK